MAEERADRKKISEWKLLLNHLWIRKMALPAASKKLTTFPGSRPVSRPEKGDSPAYRKNYSLVLPASVFFFSLIFVLLVYFLFAGTAGEIDSELKVMTFNLRFDNPADGPHGWPHRLRAVVELIKTQAVDLCGTQEVLKNQLADLLLRLPEYNYVGVGREDGKEAGEFSAIFYRRDRFTPETSGTFWLSQSPEIPGSKGWDAACERIVTWGIFRLPSSGKRLAVFNTHFDHLGETARRESARLLVKKIKELAGKLPVILTGDFNAPPGSEPVKIILESGWLLDSRAEAVSLIGPAWSFHGFGRVPEERRPLIDFIFVSRHFSVLEYNSIFREINGTYYSDHNPIAVRLKWKRETD